MSSNVNHFSYFSYQLNNQLSNRSFYHAEFIKQLSFVSRCKLVIIGDLKVANFYKEMVARAAKLNPSKVICNRRTDKRKAKSARSMHVVAQS